jgi:hypothetical protein
MTKRKEMTIQEIIDKAISATRIVSEHISKDAFRATEKRLYAYPVIKLKIEDDREKLQEITVYGAPGKSKSIVRFSRSGQRLTPEEIRDALIADLKAEISGNEQEIKTIDKAIKILDGDAYSDIVKYRFFDGKSDDEISLILCCDPSTVRRNKSRLVQRLAVFLYGSSAVL